MHVVPVPLNVTAVRSQNDLNPVISTFRSLSKVSPLVPHRTLISDWHATTTRATILSRPLVGGATPLRNKHHGPLVQRETNFIFREGVTVDDNPTVTRSPVKTFGRFSIRAQPPGA